MMFPTNDQPCQDICGNGITGNAGYYSRLTTDSPFRHDQQPPPIQNHRAPTFSLSSLSGIIQPLTPKNPQYSNFNVRLSTFDDPRWPKDSPVTPSELAEAGFYYFGDFAGHLDAVECFFCGKGVCLWEPGDNAWSEHKRISPSCLFINDFHNRIRNGELPPVNNDVNSQTSNVSIDDEGYSSQTSQLSQSSSNNSSQSSPISSSPPSSLEWTNLPSCSPPDDVEKSLSVNSLPRTHNHTCVSSCDRLLCKVCLTEELGVVFLPCGHLVSCTRCAVNVTKCPLCREPITSTIRTYL